MKPGKVYIGEFNDVQADSDNQLDSILHQVYIYDTSVQIEDDATEEQIYMQMAGEPVREITSDDNESKFTPILSRSYEINVLTDDKINLSTFAGSDDNRWKVIYKIAGQTVFIGYLLLDDLQMEFMPDPNVLLLVATDNLGITKDKPLTDLQGNNPSGVNRLIDYLVWALAATNLALPIKVFNNLREEDSRPFTSDTTFATGPNQIGVFTGPSFFRPGKKIQVSNTSSNNGIVTIESVLVSGATTTLNVAETLVNEVGVDTIFTDVSANFYNDCFVHAKTWEKEIGESIDAYTVIQRILGDHCRLIQQWGAWWIISVDELDNFQMRGCNYDEEGNFVDNDDPTTYTKEIGLDNNESIQFINEDAIVKPTMPHKFIKETFKLQTPKEIVCNINFSRGELIQALSGFSKFRIEDWTHGIEQASAISLAAAVTTAYIRRNYDGLGYEKERFAVVPHESGGAAIRTCAVEVAEKDRIKLTFDYALSADSGVSGSVGPNIAYVLLFGDDGTYWTLAYGSLSHPNGTWVESNGTFTSNLTPIKDTYDSTDINQTESRSLTVDSLNIPVTGKLYIQLRNPNFNSEASDIYFNGLQLEYRAYINDGYLPIKEQYHKITGVVNNNVKRENEVFIGDSPRKIFKGALLKYNGFTEDYDLVERFYKANIYTDNDPPDEALKTFGEWQAWWIWNQYRLCNREFDFTAQGLDTNTLKDSVPNPISPVHTFFLTDVTDDTNGRYFMLLHHEAGMHIGEWNGFLSEVYKEDEGKDYGIGEEEIVEHTGRWLELIYNIGAGNVTVYYMDVTTANPSGYYKQNTPSVPPYPAGADLSDFTYVGAGIADLLADLGIDYTDLVDVNTGVADSVISSTTIVYGSTHEFKYVLE